MSEHTEGELKASGNGIHIGMKCIAVTHAESKELRDADARRIAACWNACAGIPTEKLEEHKVSLCGKSYVELEQQRDELLAALKEAKKEMPSIDSLPKTPTRIRELVEMVDAAIAKAEA